MSHQKEELRQKFSGLGRYGSKFDRALDVVLAGGVKEALFLPSGRKVYSVVGKLGDEFIDPEKPYCSCANFYFKVTRGTEEVCYHLLAHRIASSSRLVDVVEFSDEEYSQYFEATVSDVFEVLGSHEG